MKNYASIKHQEKVRKAKNIQGKQLGTTMKTYASMNNYEKLRKAKNIQAKN